MVDVTDLKSVARKGVQVRLLPGVPFTKEVRTVDERLTMFLLVVSLGCFLYCLNVFRHVRRTSRDPSTQLEKTLSEGEALIHGRLHPTQKMQDDHES